MSDELQTDETVAEASGQVPVDAAVAADEPAPDDGDPDGDEQYYAVTVANQRQIRAIFGLLLRAYNDRTRDLPLPDEDAVMMELALAIAQRRVYVLLSTTGREVIVAGAMAWMRANVWYAPSHVLVRDMFLYVLPNHRGKGAVDLIKFAIRDARQRQPAAEIMIDDVNAMVDKDKLWTFFRSIGMKEVGRIYIAGEPQDAGGGET